MGGLCTCVSGDKNSPKLSGLSTLQRQDKLKDYDCTYDETVPKMITPKSLKDRHESPKMLCELPVMTVED